MTGIGCQNRAAAAADFDGLAEVIGMMRRAAGERARAGIAAPGKAAALAELQAEVRVLPYLAVNALHALAGHGYPSLMHVIMTAAEQAGAIDAENCNEFRLAVDRALFPEPPS